VKEVIHHIKPYYQKVAWFNVRNTLQSAVPLKELTLLLDRLNNDDWQVITSYLKLLKPLKHATMKL
jgi:hypothetical protein